MTTETSPGVDFSSDLGDTSGNSGSSSSSSDGLGILQIGKLIQQHEDEIASLDRDLQQDQYKDQATSQQLAALNQQLAQNNDRIEYELQRVKDPGVQSSVRALAIQDIQNRNINSTKLSGQISNLQNQLTQLRQSAQKSQQLKAVANNTRQQELTLIQEQSIPASLSQPQFGPNGVVSPMTYSNTLPAQSVMGPGVRS